ncbi:MAG: hypothetical protein V3T23_02325 [Nitrososphaerales archaeon]
MSKQLKSIALFPLQVTRHSIFVFSAILDFCRSNSIDVRYRIPRNRILSTQNDGIVVAVFESPNHNELTVGFDMGDYPHIASIEGLDLCDIYVKRSYDSSLLSSLPSGYRQKVVPLGMYHACSPKQPFAETHLILSACVGAASLGISAFRKTLVNTTRLLVRSAFGRQAAFPMVDRFRQLRSIGQQTVFFHTRIWDPNIHKSFYGRNIREVNAFRKSLVSALRDNLGEKFIGGIIENDYARRDCPDLISSHSADFSTYMNLLKNSRIAITETGLHASTGSRLPEYFAAGRCIVSEPLEFEIPIPPTDGIEWHTYQDVDSCMEVCIDLLNDIVSVDSAMTKAATYYDQHVMPEKQIETLITRIGTAITSDRN